jgi:hypothetical protein
VIDRMVRDFTLVLLGVFATALAVAAPASGQSAIPVLTAAEKAAGWRMLFDGKTTAGWRAFRGTEMPAGWTVEGGVLSRTAKAADIVSLEEFGDFELAFEWKIGAAGNSGVMYRVTEDSTAPWHSAHEYQILDNAGHADGKVPETTAASAYALYAPAKDVTKPLGQWNQARIVVKGMHVEHWLNGTKVVAFDIGSAEWTARYEKSKFAKYPQFGKAVKGRIAIQDHGDPVSYRNIRIRPL